MLKKVAVALSVFSLVVTGAIIFQSYSSLKNLSVHHGESPVAPAEEHAAKTEGHGGGHGQATTEEHGEAKAEGHGEAKAEGHGGGHGEEKGDRGTAHVKSAIPFISIDEVFANVAQDKKNYTLAIKLDVEFFNEEGKQAFKTHQSVVRDLIIQTSREQEYDLLSSLSGKLYFKELLIRKMNEHFHGALVKDVHFASFFLQ